VAQLSHGYSVTEVGPFGMDRFGKVNAGAVSAILAHPTNPNIIWLGTLTSFVDFPLILCNVGSVNGGVWKTTNGGASWTSLTDLKVPSYSVSHLSFDPTDASLNTIIAAIGSPSNDAGLAGNAVGVYYTTNGGTSWTVPAASTFQSNGLILRQAYKIGSKIVACIRSASWYGTITQPFFVSNDLGATWTAKGPSSGSVSCADMAYVHSTTTFVAALMSNTLNIL